MRLPGCTGHDRVAEQAGRLLPVGHAGLRGPTITKLALSFSTVRRNVTRPISHRGSVSEYGRCPVWITDWPGRLPCTDITRLHSIRLVAGLQRYYAAIRLPEGHLPSSLIRLVGHTRSFMTGVS